MTVRELLFWRFFQAFGVSGGLAVGAAVIGDIYKLEERGSAMGVFFAVSVPLALENLSLSNFNYIGCSFGTGIGSTGRR